MNLMNFPFSHKKQVLDKWFNNELPIDYNIFFLTIISDGYKSSV